VEEVKGGKEHWSERDRDVAGKILKGKCPFGQLKKGQLMGNCLHGFPGCGCADEWMLNPCLDEELQVRLEKLEKEL
jgi:hypothetical protein